MKTTKAVEIFLYILLIVGAVGFFVPFINSTLSAFGARLVSTKIQFPNTFEYPSDLFVDKKGNIFCHGRSSHRVQIYDNAGKFIIGWFVPYPSLLMLNEEETNLIFLCSDDKQVTYDLNGNLLNKTKLERGAYRNHPKLAENVMEYKDAQGNIYKYSRTFLKPYVIKITPDGREYEIILKEPFYLWPFRWFFPGVFFVIIPVVVWGVARKFQKNRQNNSSLKTE